MFCDRLSSQLAAQEEKQRNAKKKKGKLFGDGLPRLLTGDDFFDRVVDFENTAAEEEIAREDRRKKRDERAEVMTAWKRAEALRLERNKTRRQTFKDDLGAWEVERDLAKLEKRRTRWNQPKLGKLEPRSPKPTFEDTGEEADMPGASAVGGNGDGEDEGTASDGESDDGD